MATDTGQVLMTQGARIPVLSGTITRPGGLPFGIDEGDIAEVRLRLHRTGSPAGTYAVDEEVDAYALSEEGTEITWRYDWRDGDTGESGHYRAQLRVRLADGRDAYAPTDDRGIPVRIVPQV